MRYEPISYIYQYEIGALAIYLIIVFRYFSARRFPDQKNRMSALILCITVLNIVLDILSSFIIDNVFGVPLFITYLINSLFYATTILMLVFMTLYTLALVSYIDKKGFKKIFPLFIPAIVVLLLLVSNPLTHLFFYVDAELGYVHGSLFIMTYITCLVYLIITLIIVINNRSVLRREEYITILVFLAVVLIATVVQFVVSSLLIIGVAIMFAVSLMYFTIQNPESMIDATTNAFTYEAMLTFLQNRRNEQGHIQLIGIKIHNMSRINGLLGIENGSLLLKQVCGYMQESCKDVWVFRMRGSCFVAITSDRKDYDILSELMKQRTSQVWTVGSTEVLLQASVCMFASEDLYDSPISAENAVKLLEYVFSQSTQSGERIRFTTVGKEIIEKNIRRQAVELALREALCTGEGLDLFFQPLWSVKRQRFTSAEVLLRFNHPVLGNIPPDEFVRIAENCGLVAELDEWVIRKACEMIAIYRFEEIGIEKLDINLSALEFMHRRLPELLNSIMAQYLVNPSFLCFEITETAATESFEVLKDCMQKICGYGSVFALDDFGIGYANISQVLELPFSVIKLDKSLLYHSGEVLADMAKVFSRMNRDVVVEGVETVEQAKLCESCQIEYAQGFYYARPMNQHNFFEFMKNNNKI